MNRLLFPARYFTYLLNTNYTSQASYSSKEMRYRSGIKNKSKTRPDPVDAKFKRRWITNEKWPKESIEGKPWAPNVPMEHNEKPWTEENAYFGMYDFMDILGNDVTMQPKLLCKGPSYMRGQKLTELQMLINRRKIYGYRMHAEDLHSVNKRIKYLMKCYNRVRETHG